jgi:hypothetical protein
VENYRTWTFTLRAIGAATQGTVVPSIDAGLVEDATGAFNQASASIDNSVYLDLQLGLTIEQKVAQADPADTLPIEWDIAFTDPIDPATFDISDITQNGTATGVTWNLINSGDNQNYTLQATAVGTTGTVIPSVAAGIVDTPPPVESNLVSFSIDNEVLYQPTFAVTIEQKGAQPDPTGSFPVEFDVVFSQAIDASTFTITDIVQNGTATSVTWNIINSGDDTNFTLQATLSSDGTVQPSIDYNMIDDGAGTVNAASTSTDNEVTVKTTFTVAIDQKGAQPDPTAALPIEFDVVFEQPIDDTTFTDADIVQNGTATGITWNIINSGDDINFTLQATAIVGEGTVEPSIAIGTIQDPTGANNLASTSTDNYVDYGPTFDVTIEQKAAQADPTASVPIEFDVVFTRVITAASFTTADITQGGTASGITWNIINSGDDMNFTLQATAVTTEGTVIPSLAALTVQDTIGGNNNTSTSTDNDVTYKTTFDVAIDQKGAQADPTGVLPIEFDVVFTDPITAASFTTADITQNGTATGITWNIINSGDDTHFTLQATAITGEGTVIPSIAATLVQSPGGMNNNASTATDNDVTYVDSIDFTINQKGTQADPTASLPVEFDVVFESAIDNTTFTTADITQNGTATGITWNIINSGDDINFTLQATAVAGEGTIIPSLAGSTVQNAITVNNNPSTSTDNDVTYRTTINVTVNQKGAQADPTASVPV